MIIMRFLAHIFIVYVSSVVVGQYYHYYNLTQDPFEATNLYYDPASKQIVNSLEISGMSWISQVGTTEYPGDDPVKDPNFSYSIEQIYHTKLQPNIVFFLVDDWGYNDFGLTSINHLQGTTPNIDRLAMEGIRLTNYYTYELCTPSRAAFLTGRYAFRFGLQGNNTNCKGVLPTTEVTIAQELKSVGYRTYLIGKWGEGGFTNSKTPNYRGFDYFYGYHACEIDYYTKMDNDGKLDLWENNTLVAKPVEVSSSTYSAYLWSQKAEAIIKDHVINHASEPMFLYFASQLVHFPFEAPQEYIDKCLADTTTKNQTYCAMNILLDETVGNLTCALEKYGLASNTIFVLTSDNGGSHQFPASSYPLRGTKSTEYNGGLMVNAFIHGSIIIDPSRRGGTYGGQVHVTDWLPTLLGLATNKLWRGSYIPGTVIDGKDIWDAIINDTPSPREEIVLYYSKANNATSKTDDFVYQKNKQKVINMHQNPNYSSTLLLFDPNQPNPTQTQCVNPQ